jgi:H+-transporting ATPase
MADDAAQPKVTGDLNQLAVEDLYDKDKYDLSTMEQQDVMQLLQYVFFYFIFLKMH